MAAIVLNAVLAEDNNFTRLDITNEPGVHSVQRTGFRSDHICAGFSFSIAKRAEAHGITKSDEFGGRHQHTGISSLQARHGAGNRLLGGGGVQAFGNDGINDGFRIRGSMEDGAVQLMIPAQGVGVHQIAVVTERHVSLHMTDHHGLNVVDVLAAGGGVAHMAHCNVGVPQSGEILFGENIRHQTIAAVLAKQAVIRNGDAAALLSAMLQGIESKVGFPGNGRGFSGIDAKHAALLMNAVKHAFYQPSIPKKGQEHHESAHDTLANGVIIFTVYLFVKRNGC